MNIWLFQGFILAAGVLAAVGWWSVQSLIQARLLRTCRSVSMAGLSGRPAALRGPVRVRRVLRVAHIGDCLWHREVVKVSGGLGGARDVWLKEGDTSGVADFSIVVGGEEVRVAESPTEVQGKATKSTDEKAGWVEGLVGAMDQRVTDEWLPLMRTLTVVGRVRRAGAGWEIGADAKAGLLFSIHDPDKAASSESLKGWLGLGVSLAGFAMLATMFLELSAP